MLTLDLIRRTNSDDISYTIAYLGGNHTLVPEYENAGADVIHFNSRTKRPQLDPIIPANFFNTMQKKGFDILHGHMPYVQVLARLAAYSKANCEVVSTYHLPQENLPSLSEKVVSLTESLDSASVAVSDAVRRSYTTASPAEPSNSNGQWHTIYNGINIEEFHNVRDSDSRATVFETGEPIFLNVGRYTQQKGQEYLIAAMKHVVETLPGAETIIVGSGPRQDKLEQLVSTLGLEESVTITGEVSDIKKFYSLADVFVFSSLYEGLPISGLEAMAAELPIVGTRVAGIEELVIDNQTGFLVPPRAPEKLAEAMIAFESAQKRKQMGQQGFKRVNQCFGIELTVDRYHDLYRTVLSEETA